MPAKRVTSGFCMPQTPFAMGSLFITVILHILSWVALIGWVSGASFWYTLILTAIIAVAIILHLLVIVSRIADLRRRKYHSEFPEDVEFELGWMGFLGYALGLLFVVYTLVGHVPVDFDTDIRLGLMLRLVYVYLQLLTFMMLCRGLFNYAAKGIDDRRVLASDGESFEDRELYQVLPPLTLPLFAALIVQLVLFVISMLAFIDVLPGTEDSYHLFYNYYFLGMGIFYILLVRSQWDTRLSRTMRLSRDIEFGHTMSALLFVVTFGTLHLFFTAQYSAADYATNVTASLQLKLLYFTFVIIPFKFVLEMFFNIPAKGNEMRRASTAAGLTE